MSMPRVLIVTTTYEKKDYCFDEFMERASQLTYPNFHHIIVDNSPSDRYVKHLRRKGYKNIYHVERGNNTREAIARSMNFGRKIMLEGDYDYMFVLESDVFPPFNIIEALMIQAKSVITGLYFIGEKETGQRVPCITISDWNDSLKCWGTRLLKESEFMDYYQKGVKQVQAGGFGCCLIERYIVEMFPFYYCYELKGHPDIFFFNELHNHKIPVYCHTDAVCAHDNRSWSTVEDR